MAVLQLVLPALASAFAVGVIVYVAVVQVRARLRHRRDDLESLLSVEEREALACADRVAVVAPLCPAERVEELRALVAEMYAAAAAQRRFAAARGAFLAAYAECAASRDGGTLPRSSRS